VIANITGAEYFYDTDPGFGNGTAATITPTENPNEFTVELATTDVSCDFHDFYIRLQNSDGTWSLYDYGLDVEVYDNANPTLVTFPNITAELDVSGQATIALADVDNGTFDDCQLVSVALNQTQFNYTCANLGANTVTITATDAEAKVSSEDVTITVVDLINPVAIAQDIIVQLDASGNATITASDIENGSTDNCSIATYALSKTNFDCSNMGDNVTIQLDANGNATVSANDVDNNSTDNCTIASSLLDKTAFTCANLGANSVTLTITDQDGNSESATAIVTVVDNVSPTVATQNISVQLDASGTASISTADIDNGSTDNCDISTMSLDTTSFNCDDLGANTVTLSVTDSNGNTGTNTAIITVQDNINPVAIGDDIIRYLEPDTFVSITANDVNNGSSDNCNVSLSLSEDTFTAIGIYPVVLTATDSFGNSNSISVNVTIVDATLDINEETKNDYDIKIYPNPADREIHIASEVKIDVIEIIDMSGKLISKIKNTNNTLDVSQLSKGMYILRLFSEKNVTNKQLVKK